jgi:hypothetical protein
VISGVVGFVDDQQIVLVRGGGTEPAQLFEADEVRADFSGAKRVRPHLRQCSGCDDETARITACDSGCDEGLAHADLVAEQGATEFVDRFFDPLHGRQLVRLQRNGADPRLNRVVTENESSDAGADFIPGR